MASALGRWQPPRAGRSPPGRTEPQLLAQDAQELILPLLPGTAACPSQDKGTCGTWGQPGSALWGQGCGYRVDQQGQGLGSLIPTLSSPSSD